jgi:hypothetical protein
MASGYDSSAIVEWNPPMERFRLSEDLGHQWILSVGRLRPHELTLGQEEGSQIWRNGVKSACSWLSWLFFVRRKGATLLLLAPSSASIDFQGFAHR